MHNRWPRALLLLLSCCLVGKPATAQRVAIPPVAPRQVAVQVGAPDGASGVSVRPAAPLAAARPPCLPTESLFSVPKPLLLLNTSIIVGENFLSGLNPQEINTLMVYKGTDAPAQWRSLVGNGILDIILKARKTRVKSKTFAQLGRGLHLAGPVSYRVNGLPVADAQLRIATDAIAEVQVVRATPAAPCTVVSVRTVVLPHAPKNDPPGAVYIRGTAAR